MKDVASSSNVSVRFRKWLRTAAASDISITVSPPARTRSTSRSARKGWVMPRTVAVTLNDPDAIPDTVRVEGNGIAEVASRTVIGARLQKVSGVPGALSTVTDV